VWAPFADAVSVIGSFNEWSETADQMVKDETGVWSVTVGHAEVGQEYKYVLKHGDKVLYKNDPRALQLTASGDNSLIVDTDFDWQDQGFQMPAANDQVIYELHLGTFNRDDPATPGGFKTAIAKLDYLKELGVNVIELMPVTSTTADRWWGYDPDYLFAVEAAYGGRRAFLEFVQAAHQKGIAVILDVVYNHMSPYEGMDLWQFDGWSENDKGGIYFYNDWRGDTPWGPRLDYGRPEVRQYITDNIRMWLKDCHVDGIRADAVFQIRNALGRNNDPGSDIADGWKLLQEITAAAKEANPHSLTVAEDMAINEYITKAAGDGGAGFDAQWETSLPSTLREVLLPLNDRDRNLEPLAKAVQKNYNGRPWQRVVYSESHDADANGHARTNEEIAPGDSGDQYARRRSTLAAAFTMTIPGIPMLFQGQEFMESGWFNHWQALDWGKTGQYAGIVQLYRDLIRLRHNHREVTKGLQGDHVEIIRCDNEAKVLAYHRWDQGGPKDDTVVILNFSNQPLADYEIGLPSDGNWITRFNSDWTGYSQDFLNSPTPDLQATDRKAGVNLGPYSAIILSQD
jgi:1,4-alpha-glucan branching enzyme